jgi:hypothetical protein
MGYNGSLIPDFQENERQQLTTSRMEIPTQDEEERHSQIWYSGNQRVNDIPQTQYEEPLNTRRGYNSTIQHHYRYQPREEEQHEWSQPIGRDRRIPDGTLEDRIFDRIQRWNVSFSGRGDPIDFLDRVDTRQRLPLNKIPFFLAEKLTGTALAWWRNRRQEWNDWDSFKRSLLEHFLPTDFEEDLQERIKARTQRHGRPSETIHWNWKQ